MWHALPVVQSICYTEWDGDQISLSSPYTAVRTCEINFRKWRTFHKHADARTDDCISASVCVCCPLRQVFLLSCSIINDWGKSCMCVASQTDPPDQNINHVILKAVIHYHLTYVPGVTFSGGGQLQEPVNILHLFKGYGLVIQGCTFRLSRNEETTRR